MEEIVRFLERAGALLRERLQGMLTGHLDIPVRAFKRVRLGANDLFRRALEMGQNACLQLIEPFGRLCPHETRANGT